MDRQHDNKNNKLRTQLASYYTNRAAAYEKLRRFEEAIKDCQDAIGVDPQFVKSYLRQAKLKLQEGQLEESIELYDEAFRLRPDNPAGRFREQAYSTKRKYSRSVMVVEKLRNKDPVQANELKSTLDDLKLVNKACPRWTTSRLYMAEILVAAGETDEAYQLTNKLLTKRGMEQDSDLLIVRATVLFNKSKTLEAMTHLRTLLALDPDNTRAVKLLKAIRALVKIKEEGDANYKKRNYHTALALYTEALELCPRDSPGVKANLHFNRASTQNKLHREDECIQDCSQAIRYDPKYIKAYVQRANTLMGLNNNNTHHDDDDEDNDDSKKGRIRNCEQAVSDYEKAIKLCKTTTETRDIGRRLRKAHFELKMALRKDFYAILGVDPQTTTPEEIKRQYRTLALRFHPDRQRSKTETERKYAEERFQDINLAYETLSDPKRKMRYDDGANERELEDIGNPGVYGPMAGSMAANYDPKQLFEWYQSQQRQREEQ